jgi:hypothetical protein
MREGDFDWDQSLSHAERGIAELYNILYNSLMKPIEFRGTALDDLRQFPGTARRQTGFQLDQVQRGRQPDDGSR